MKNPHIQVLRGVAILGVITFHLSGKFSFGYLGVDIFFVISGFLMTPRLMQLVYTGSTRAYFDYHEMIRFFQKRFRRLSPALGAGLIFTALASVFFADPHDLHRISMQGIFTILLIGNFGAQRYAGDYFHPNPIPLIHTWSLSAEEQIYILIPVILIVLLFCLRVKKFRWFVFFLSLFMISFIGDYLIVKTHHFTIGSIGAFDYYSPLAHLWQFCLGALTYLYSLNLVKKSRPQKNWSLILCCFLILALLVNPNEALNVNLCLFTSLAMTTYVLLNSKSDYNQITKLKTLVFLGEISYPLYIFHLPVIYFFNYSPSVNLNFVHGFLKTLFCIVTFLAFAIACYYFVERRSHKFTLWSLFAKWTIFPLFVLLIVNSTSNMIFKLTLTPSGTTKTYNSSAWCDIHSKRVCRFKNEDLKKSILIVGDSHARTLAGSILTSEIFPKKNVFVSLNDGCRFSIPRINSENSCDLANMATIFWIKKNKPALLIVTGRAIRPNDSKELWNRRQSEFVRSYTEILRNGQTNVIVLGPNREFEPSNFFQTLIGRSKGMEEYSIMENDFLETAIRKMASNRIEFVNPNIFLCHVVCGRKELLKYYFDNDHLNSRGTDQIVDAMTPQILQKVH